MTAFKNYLGKWLVNDATDPQKCQQIECVSVNDENRTCKFIDEEGKTFYIKMFDLDNSGGKYEKIYSIYDAPDRKQGVSQISESLKKSAPQSKVLGDLSKIGHNSKVNESLRTENVEETQHHESHEFDETYESHEKIKPQIHQETRLQQDSHFDVNDPIAAFISSAIKMSRRASKKITIPVKINLELDFDILTVIGAAMQLGASDVEILQHIIKEINISTDDIKKSLFTELLKSPEDVDIAMSNREDVFNETLKKELADKDNPTYTQLD